MQLYLIRHGETEMNKRKCYYGQTDSPLTEKGREQAKEAGRFLSDIAFDKVIASPLSRAVDTAKLILEQNAAFLQKGTPKGGVSTDPNLAEQNFGIFEGMTYEEMLKRFPEESDAWNQDYYQYRIPGGESFSDLRKRTDQFLLDLSREEGTILVVSHKGPMGHLLAGLLAMPLTGFWNFTLEQGCYSRVDLEDGYAILRKLNADI